MKSQQDKTDPRVMRTKRVLKENLLTLLQNQPVSKVSVSELCRLSEINRSTFYKYYADPADLLRHIEEALFISIKNQLTGSSCSIGDLILSTARNMTAHQELCKILFSPHGDISFINTLFYLSYEQSIALWKKRFPAVTDSELDYLYIFLAEGSKGMIQKWIMGGFRENPDYIAHMAESFCLEGLQAFAKNRALL